MKPLIKNIIIGAVIFVVLVVIYFAFFKSNPAPALVSSSGAPVSAAAGAGTGPAVGQEFLNLLLNVRNIKLDDSILNLNSFKSLQDFTITLTPEGNEGRINPFAPIGVETSGGGATSTQSITIGL